MAGLLIQNTAGDRKELRAMLSALPPLERVRFLCECVAVVNRPGTMASARHMPLREAKRCDAADAVVTDRVYCDLLYLSTQHGLDLDAAVTRLAGYVARPADLRDRPSLRKPLADAVAVGRATRRP